MSMKKIVSIQLERVINQQKQTNCLLDKLCKKITKLNKNISPGKTDAWLGFENRERAAELREKNPETFEMVSELLKMYLGYDDSGNNS